MRDSEYDRFLNWLASDPFRDHNRSVSGSYRGRRSYEILYTESDEDEFLDDIQFTEIPYTGGGQDDEEQMDGTEPSEELIRYLHSFKIRK